jgi:hypothetical protein
MEYMTQLLDDEFNNSLEAYDKKLDSMQAGTAGAGTPPLNANTPNLGAFGWVPQMQQQAPEAPAMPEAYSQNRSAQYGMPGIMQFGESLVDDYRANKWQSGQDELAGALGASEEKPGSPAGMPPPIVVDEVQMLNAQGDPQTAYDNAQAGGNTGSGAARAGQGVREIMEALMQSQTGGMGGFA